MFGTPNDPRKTYLLETPQAFIVEHVREYSRFLQVELLSRIGMFDRFKVLYAAHDALGREFLGRYCHGSCGCPVMWVDLTSCEKSAKAHGVSFEAMIQTTILHELGHAIQEYHGLPFEEGQAEGFAQQFFHHNHIWRFWSGGPNHQGSWPSDDPPF